MKRSFAVALFSVLAFANVHAQTDNTIYARMFKGNTVGAKVTAAMATCGTNVVVPCIIVIDPSLAAYATGAMPTLCSHCYLADFRYGWPGGGGGSGYLPLTAGAGSPLTGTLYANAGEYIQGTSFVFGTVEFESATPDTPTITLENGLIDFENATGAPPILAFGGYASGSYSEAIVPGPAGFDASNGSGGHVAWDASQYLVNGNPFGTANLADWSNAGAAVNYVATCIAITSGICTAWAPQAAGSGSGFLPLAAGPSYPLTGELFANAGMQAGTGALAANTQVLPSGVTVTGAGSVPNSTVVEPGEVQINGAASGAPWIQFTSVAGNAGIDSSAPYIVEANDGSGPNANGKFNAAGYDVAGSPIATGNLHDWSDGSATVGMTATCVSVSGGTCINWAPRTSGSAATEPPYLQVGTTLYDSNFNAVTTPTCSEFTSMDSPGDVSGNYTCKDASSSTGTYPGGFTNGDMLLIGGYNNEAQTHFYESLSGQTEADENFGLISLNYSSESANGGLIFCDSVNDLLAILYVYGQGVGPLQLQLSLFQADYNGVTKCVGPYPLAGWWNNLNAPPSGPLYGAAATVIPSSPLDPSNIYLRMRYVTTINPPGGGPVSVPAWIYEYSLNGSFWNELGPICASVCVLNHAVGPPTAAGPYYYTGNARGPDYWTTSTFDLKSFHVQ